jgi:hypothetical protein
MARKYEYLLNTGVVLTKQEREAIEKMIPMWHKGGPIGDCPMCSLRIAISGSKSSCGGCLFTRLEGEDCIESGPHSRWLEGRAEKRECLTYLKRILELPVEP